MTKARFLLVLGFLGGIVAFASSRPTVAAPAAPDAEGTYHCAGSVKPVCLSPMHPVCVCTDTVGANCDWACGN